HRQPNDRRTDAAAIPSRTAVAATLAAPRGRPPPSRRGPSAMPQVTDSAPLLLFTGPCVVESLDLCREVATVVAGLRDQRSDLDVVFKASFDKANRTSISSFRGCGFD